MTDRVECPSLSADGTRIAFKSAVDGNPMLGRRIAVLRLADGVVTPLAETRSGADITGGRNLPLPNDQA
ncbi:hypothetical protein R8Z50_21340 [Longispora sp. K20-0274]|uniref:hypothetical protein n=1 Tax=Longispora sp. K20-0274 TaxID=3088255 RepID=UPI00399C0B4C